MKKKFKTIKEQSDRIKSLFSEERLYGNLVTEQSTDEECVTQLQSKGYMVTVPTDIVNKYRVEALAGCLKLRNGEPTKLGRIWTFLSNKAGNNVRIEVDGDNAGNCKLIFSNTATCKTGTTDGEDRIIVSIYGGDAYSDEFNLQVLYHFVQPVKYKKGALTVKLTYIRYEGRVKIASVDSYDNVTSMTYDGLTATDVYRGSTKVNSLITGFPDEKFSSYSTTPETPLDSSNWTTFKEFLFKQSEKSSSGDFLELVKDGFLKCKNWNTNMIYKRIPGLS